MKKTMLLVLAIIIASPYIHAQNLQQYTPSVLLAKSQLEIKLFNNLYTQTHIRDESRNKQDIGQRQSFLNNQLRIVYGVSDNKRLNVGLEANYSFAKYGESSSGILDILSSGESYYDHSQFTSIGPSVRFTPIERIGNFSVTSTLLIPIKTSTLERPRFTNHNRYTWWTQVFYDYSFNQEWNLFMEVDALVRFKNEETQNSFFRTPVSAFLSYFPNAKFTVYANAQYSPAFGKNPSTADEDFELLQSFTQVGAGLKYFVTPSIELEASYTNFVTSKSAGAGETYNLGIRILR